MRTLAGGLPPSDCRACGATLPSLTDRSVEAVLEHFETLRLSGRREAARTSNRVVHSPSPGGGGESSGGARNSAFSVGPPPTAGASASA